MHEPYRPSSQFPHGPRDSLSRSSPDPLRDPWLPAMGQALAEATAAAETGDVPVGAVVLGPGGPEGRVLGTGRNAREASGDPTAHAEVLALRAAAAHLGGWRLSGCTLVVTLEPCTMCAGAGVLARVDRVVYGAPDPKAGAVGSLWDVMRDRRLNHRPEVIPEVLGRECGEVLSAFFRERTGRAGADSRPGPGPGPGPTAGRGD